MSRTHYTHHGLLWYSAETPPPDRLLSNSFLVAIDLDGHCFVTKGTRTRGKIRGIGCSVPPYAWAWMPGAPPQYKVRPFKGKAGGDGNE